MLEKLQNQTKHWTICHVRKKGARKECKKCGEKESIAFSTCDSIYISHPVKDMIVQRQREWKVHTSVASFHLSLIFCFGTSWHHSLLFCNDSSCQPYIMMLKRYALHGFALYDKMIWTSTRGFSLMQ